MKKYKLIVILLLLALAQAAQAMPLYLDGLVKNSGSGMTSGVAITIEQTSGNSYRAIGIFDSITLFGRFNIPGKAVKCEHGEELCLVFDGDVLFGDDDSGFPSFTRTDYRFSLNISGNRASGGYWIAPLLPWSKTEQPGTLELSIRSDELVFTPRDQQVAADRQNPTALWNRAIAHDLAGHYARAEQDFSNYIKLKPDAARGYGYLARTLVMQRKLPQAVEAATRAIRLEPDSPLWRAVEGHARLLQGETQAARKSYEHAVDVMLSERQFEQTLAYDLQVFRGNEWEAGEINRLSPLLENYLAQSSAVPFGQAEDYTYDLEYTVATPLIREALARVKKSAPAIYRARIERALADNLVQLGRYHDALQHYRAVLDVLDNSAVSNTDDRINIRLSLASLYSQIGKFDLARKFYEEALALSDSDIDRRPIDKAEMQTTVAMFYYSMGELDKAEALYQKAIPLLEAYLGPTHKFMATHYNNRALIAGSRGDYAQAIDGMTKSLAVARQYYDAVNLNIAISLGNLANQYLAWGKPEQAESLLLEALVIAAQLDHPGTTLYLNNSMRIALQNAGRKPEAIVFGKQAVNSLQRVRKQNLDLDESLRQSFVESKSSYYRDLADLLIEEGRLAEAQQVLSMLKEEEYFDFIRRDANSDAGESQVGYIKAEQDWLNDYEAISRNIAALGAEMRAIKQVKRSKRTPEQKQRYKALQAELDVAMKAFNHSVQKLKDDFASLDKQRYGELTQKQIDLDMRGTVRALKHDSVLIHYLMLKDNLHILLTTPDIMLARKVEISNAELNRLVQNLRTALQNPRMDPHQPANALYMKLFAPIEEDIRQAGAKMLMVSLDGALRYIPMAALYDGEHYLVENYALSVYTDAARDRIKDRSDGDWEIAGLGLSRAVDGFDPLPSVPGELDAIVQQDDADQKGVIPGVVYLDEEFNAESLKTVLLDEYPVLHIASHFVFKPGTLENSFLLLGDGSRLPLSEIQSGNYDLGSIDLMTLSACETALGDNAGNGSEVEGFATLAQKKGAKGVLATLWPVADESTGLFMQRLYDIKQASPETTKAEALRQVQREFIDGAHAGNGSAESRGGKAVNRSAKSSIQADTFSHPYYWGPFVLMGNWL